MTNNTTTARPATDRQMNFLRSLIAQKGATDVVLSGQLSTREASALIDDLLSRPTAPTAVVPEGFHVHDGTVYKVQVSKTGNAYAKVLELSGTKGRWEYAGAGPLRHLSAATLADLETAQAFGLDTGVCMCCGATLTDPESIARGIGPVCGGRLRKATAAA